MGLDAKGSAEATGSAASCRLPSLGADDEPQSVLRETPALTPGIADAVIIKDHDLYFLSRPDGRVPLGEDHALGLYYHDCRFLNGYELLLGGRPPEPLVSTGARGYMALFELTNPDIRAESGERLVRKEEIGIRWERILDDGELSLHEQISFRNFSVRPVEVPVALVFRGGFEDVFGVRALLRDLPGVVRAPRWVNGGLLFRYDGCDGLYRSVFIRLWPSAHTSEGVMAGYRLRLEPREEKSLWVTITVAESSDDQPPPAGPGRQPNIRAQEDEHRRSLDRWLGRQTEVRSDSLLIDGVVDRSLRDLRLLRSGSGDEQYYAAGVPWFTTLFGRDSIITALQTLAFDPAIAEQTLRILARHQGRQIDAWREEEPGKILHELRVGEMARSGVVPHSPYFGTIDATPLFLVLVGRHAAWRGDLALFDELRPSIDLALEWMDRFGDPQDTGYLTYQSTHERGLVNQGWKDSGDGVLNADGSVARPPIALVEVQAYAYRARMEIAELYRRAGEPERAENLEREAQELKARFNRDFWLEDRGFYALALQEGRVPAAVLSSNAGHALWGGIAESDKARRTMERLLDEDMFNGWGIRTLSEKEMGYNPIGYHLGTVWPHDNSLIAAGFKEYGFDQEACRVFQGMVRAAMHFEAYRLPELFAGFRREDYEIPVSYPLANKPQAWAAGTIPHMLETLLGLQPEAFEHRLRVVRPALPDFFSRLEVHRLRVGADRVDLRFERIGGVMAVQVLGRMGGLNVVVEL
jgi:glycogen debranching enzyme